MKTLSIKARLALVLFVLAVFLAGVGALGLVGNLRSNAALKYLKRDRNEHPLILELPSYRLPNPRNLAIGLIERARIFLRRIGTVILKMMVVLWFLSTFPSPPAGATGPAIDYSFAGHIGRALEVVFAPIGFNWQMCIALIPGMAAREVAVGALATVYSLSATHENAAAQLAPVIAAQWPLATALAFLAWYVYAPQCISTLAAIRRETNSWKVMAATAGYLFALAYLAAFITYHIARVLA